VENVPVIAKGELVNIFFSIEATRVLWGRHWFTKRGI